jgi:hypothetical protein
MSIAEMIRDAAEQAGLSFRRDYSGRGMYGRSCIAVSGHRHSIQCELFPAVIQEIAACYPDQVSEMARQLMDYQTDSMGFDQVFYWSDLQLEAESSLEDLGQEP